MARLAAILLLLAQQPPSDVDVVTLKDGTTRSGRILSESAGEIVMETLIKGSKGQVVGSARTTVDKANVAKIERASEEARKKSAERSQAFGERGVRRAEALARVVPAAAEVEGAKGFRVTGTHTVLESTCEVGFVKDVAVCLEEVFGAYRRNFDIRRNADRKVKVFLFADKEEYVRFQKRRHGDAILNAAYYHSGENYIAAYNMVQRDEERRVRAEILRVEREIEGFKMEVATVERKVDGAAREIRKRIADAAAEARRGIRADGAGGKDERLRDVDRQEKQLLEDLKKDETGAQKELQDARRKANGAIENNRKIVDRNEKLLATQNRTMFEMLFHEGFHAFAANYLWEGSGREEFPRWLNEGMAGYFEMSAVEGGELIHGAAHPAFLALLREKAVLNTWVPVDQILKGVPGQFLMTHRSEQDRATAYYAQSWALAHYLSTRATRERLAAYLADVLAGKDGVGAFERLAGKPCREVEADLRKHVDGLKAP
ncbi:MAG TPA: DUF1570 domain-containing protein [Planctomycetota bacterium]|nr:DUF1570 domain-containing protein [Planctomycetota bacterium]